MSFALLSAMTQWKKILFIVALVLIPGFLHYSCQLYLVQHTQFHNVVLKALFAPVILAAFWFGMKGGLATGLFAATLFGIDVVRWWAPDHPQNYNMISEMAIFVGMGALLGWLIDNDRKARNSRQKAEAQAEREYYRAITDSLTGAFNRRHLDHRLAEIWEAASGSHGAFSLLMVDLNNFKHVNDHHGHLMGDRVLKSIAQTIFGQIRSKDQLFRYGGDEFLILLPDTGKEHSLALANRLREEAGKLTFRGPSHRTFQADFSIGIIEYRAELPSLTDMLHRLDASLYRAKKVESRVALAS